tara:strand:- start:36028 stop:36279 length:252 start_codon:yes stop_codon:yes gene_type:complete
MTPTGLGTMPLTSNRSKVSPTLEEAQEFVGGTVEMVYLPGGNQMLVNEEGLLRNLEINNMATRIAGKMIVGDVIILTGKAVWT